MLSQKAGERICLRNWGRGERLTHFIFPVLTTVFVQAQCWHVHPMSRDFWRRGWCFRVNFLIHPRVDISREAHLSHNFPRHRNWFPSQLSELLDLRNLNIAFSLICHLYKDRRDKLYNSQRFLLMTLGWLNPCLSLHYQFLLRLVNMICGRSLVFLCHRFRIGHSRKHWSHHSGYLKYNRRSSSCIYYGISRKPLPETDHVDLLTIRY